MGGGGSQAAKQARGNSHAFHVIFTFLLVK
jgi:hypothetical protein